jgi:hypothetical protein
MVFRALSNQRIRSPTRIGAETRHPVASMNLNGPMDRGRRFAMTPRVTSTQTIHLKIVVLTLMMNQATAMTTPPNKRLLEELTEGLPRPVLRCDGVSGLSAIEWIAEAPQGQETRSQESCLGYVHAKLSSIKPSMPCSLLIRSAPWNSGSRLARYRGAWSGIDPSIRSGWLSNEESWEVAVNNSKSMWGYAECLRNDSHAMLGVFRAFDGVAIFGSRRPPLKRIKDALESFDGDCDVRPLDVAIRLCQIEAVVVCWVYPSFDDREVAVYLLGTTIAIRRLDQLI